MISKIRLKYVDFYYQIQINIYTISRCVFFFIFFHYFFNQEMEKVILSLCVFIVHPFHQYFYYSGWQFQDHLSWEGRSSTRRLPSVSNYPADRTHARQVTGLEITDSNHSVKEVVKIFYGKYQVVESNPLYHT